MLLYSCTNDDEASDTDATTVVDHMFTSAGLIPILPVALALDPGPGRWHLLDGLTCANVDSIVGDTSGFPGNGPVRIHLNYSGTGCVDLDGRKRQGVLIIELSDGPEVIGSEMSIWSDSLGSDDFRYCFGAQATCIAMGKWTYRMDSSFTLSGGAWSRRYAGSTNYERIQGAGDQDPMNDIYRLEYALSGSDRTGRTYEANSTTPIQYPFNCKWCTQGNCEILPDGLSTRTVDHGPGSCDGSVVIFLPGGEVGLTIP